MIFLAKNFASSKSRYIFAPQFAKTPPQRVFYLPNAKVAQLVEHDLAKVGVAGPSPVFRSLFVQVAELVDALL